VPALSGPSTTPDFVVGLVILALILLGQARTRLWTADRNSPLPAMVLALGLLVYFGYRSTAGPLSAQQQDYLYVTLVLGIAFGALRARTLMLWNDTPGLCVRGTPGTLALWVLTGLGMGLYYGAGNITYAGFVLYVGVTFAAQQVFVVLRGVRAARTLAGPGAAARGRGGAADRSGDDARATPAGPGTVAS
jgi:hypothetical protein